MIATQVLSTRAEVEYATVSGGTRRFTEKLFRLGLREVAAGNWTWAGNGCGIAVEIRDGQAGAVVCAVWTDGTYTDVTFFDCVANAESDQDENAMLIWLDWYVSGNRFTAKGTVGYITMAQTA